MTDFIVTEKAMRPASDKMECFYCQSPIGGAHKADCVLIMKKVKLRAIIEYEEEMPAAWDKHMIEFCRNESSWCADNLLRHLEKVKKDRGICCICSMTEIEYVSEDGPPYLSED